MKILKFKDKESWLEARRGKITGSKVTDVITKRGNTVKVGVYQLIADRLGIPADDENPIERGNRLEPVALDEFEKETGKKVNRDLVIWLRDDDDNIAISPDGYIGETEAVEVKCESSARHIENLVTKELPSNHEDQILQYFIVNDKLKKLHFVSYDDRVLARPYVRIEIKREDVQEKVDKYLEAERAILAMVNGVVAELTF